jgi:hypothetical protein
LSLFKFTTIAVVLKSLLTKLFLYKGEVKNSFFTNFLSKSLLFSIVFTSSTNSCIGLTGDCNKGTFKTDVILCVNESFFISSLKFLIVVKLVLERISLFGVNVTTKIS